MVGICILLKKEKNMGIIMDGIKHFFENLHVRLREKRYWLFFIIFCATVFLAAGMGRVVIDESVESYLRDDDPVKIAYDRFRAWFGSDEYVYVVYKAKNGDIFSHAALGALQKVHDELTNYRLEMAMGEASPLDHIKEVKSLINVKYMEARENTLVSRNFVGDILPGNTGEREVLRGKALTHPDYPKVFLSPDSEYGGILIRTDFNAEAVEDPPESQGNSSAASGFDDGDIDLFSQDENLQTKTTGDNGPDGLNLPKLQKTDIHEYPAFINALDSILEKPEYNQVLEFYPVGNPVIMNFFATAVMADMNRLMSLVLLLIIIMLFFLFRSLSAVVWPVVIVVLTIVWTLGLIGWSGIPMSAMIQVIVFIALSIGIADAVHILSGYLFFRNKNFKHDQAVGAVMKKSGPACFLTSVTTAVGLMSLVLVPLKPIASFGIFSSIAVFLAFMFTVLLLPLMLDIWSPVSKKKEISRTHFVLKLIQRVEKVGIERSGTVTALFLVVGIVLCFGVLKLKVDSNFVEVIKERLPLRKTYNVVDAHMGGSSNLEIMMEFKQENALKDPEVLFCMEAVQDFMETERGDKITRTFSLVNVVKESYKALHEDRPEKYIIPADPHVLKQVLFLFDNANSYDRKRLVSDDYSRARIGVNSLNVSSSEALDLIENIQEYMDLKFGSLKEKYPELNITLTGNMALMAIMLDYLSWSQIKSFSLALGIISLILLLVLGSWKAGAASLIPNLFPILTTFGLMGFLRIPLDADTLIVAPIIMGLAVDDTIHFMTHFRYEMNRFGNVSKAAVHAIREAGQAITFTSVILSGGFLVFLLSFHRGLSHFGIFSAIAIMTALISDVFLLPALCKIMNVDFRDGKKTDREYKRLNIGYEN